MKVKVIAMVVLLLIPILSNAGTPVLTDGKMAKAQKGMKAKIELIELIEGTPKRKFQKLAPVWSSDWMEAALKDVKTQAYKKGADAIIEFKVESQVVQQAGGGLTAAMGIYSSSEQTYPIVKGWAVKWID